MSSSMSTYITVEGREFLCEDAGDCTWNVFPMFYHALRNTEFQVESISNEWDGKNGREILPQVEAIIAEMEKTPDVYKAMNPANGWGNYESALKFMQNVKQAILDSPTIATLRVY